jgi:hypothetical protein
MKPARIVLDFIPASRRPGGMAVALLVAGLLAVGWSFLAYREAADQAVGMSLRLAEATGRRPPASAAGNNRAVAEAQAVALELQTPWVGLLDDLETATAAGKGDVALVSVEPDRRHQKLKLVAEARSLPAALQYVQRLQRNTAIRDALLESHQVMTDVPERPVRVQIVADWRMGS